MTYLSFHSVNDCLLKNFCWRAAVWKKKEAISQYLFLGSCEFCDDHLYVRYWTALSDLKLLWMCIIRFLSLPKTTRCLKTDKPDSRRTRCLCEQVYLGHRHKQLEQEGVAAMILILGLCFLSKSDKIYFVKSKIFIWTSPT